MSVLLSECIVSCRRIQLFTANIASIASVTPRMRTSLIVAQVKSPKAKYVTSAAARRFTKSNGAQGRIRTSVPR